MYFVGSKQICCLVRNVITIAHNIKPVLLRNFERNFIKYLFFHIKCCSNLVSYDVVNDINNSVSIVKLMCYYFVL